MNVKLAVQILSSSVSAALKTAIETFQIQLKTAAATADFIKMIDNLFNALNSRKLNCIKLNNCGRSHFQH